MSGYYGTVGAQAQTTGTQITASYPSGIASGDMLVMYAIHKPSSAPSLTGANMTGWTLQGTLGAGSGVAVDTGEVGITVYTREAASALSGTFTITTASPDVVMIQIARFTKDTGDTWATAFATGADTTAGTGFSATMSSAVDVASRDLLVFLTAMPTDTLPTWGTENVSGAVVGSFTTVANPFTASGSDVSGHVAYALATNTPGSVTLTYSSTLSGTTTNSYGPTALLRLRATGSTAVVPKLLDHVEVGFADGSTGHSVTLAGGTTATAGDMDVIFVGADTTVTTPTGFTLPTGGSQVSQAAGYMYYRQCAGGESASVTITTSGNHPTTVHFQRWKNLTSFDQAVSTFIDNSGATTTPTLTTGTFAATGELVIGAALVHNASATMAQRPTWWTGAQAIGEAYNTSGAAGTETGSFTAWKVESSTTADSPSASWTNSMRDRYPFAIAFQVGATGGSGSTPVTGSDTGAAAEAGTIATSMAGADTSSAVGAETLAAALTGAGDTSTTAEAAVSIGLSSSDTSTTVDAASPLTAALAGSETGSSADASTLLTAALQGSGDTGSSADAATLAAALLGGDTGSSADATAPLAASLAATETGTALDAATTAAGLAGADLGAGLDGSTLAAALAGADLGAAVEAATLAALLTAIETALGTGAESVSTSGGTSVSGADTVTGADAFTLFAAALVASETGSSADAATLLSAALVAVETATSVEGRTLAAALAAADLHTSAEGAALNAAYLVADTTVTAELAALLASLSNLDIGAAVDFAFLQNVSFTWRNLSAGGGAHAGGEQSSSATQRFEAGS